MSQCQNQDTLLLDRVQQRESEFPQHAFPNARTNFSGCFGELGDQTFNTRHFGEEASTESGRLEFEVAYFIEKLVLGRFVPTDEIHLNSLSTFRLTS